MATPIRILILEDKPDDADLMLGALRHADFDPEWQRVESEPAYLEALASNPDVILADYTLPQFDGMRALKLLQERALEIPFILVTGGYEEVGIACLKQGAADYLIKDRLGRLGAAVRNAMDEQALRAAKREAEMALRESEERYRTLFEDSRDAIIIADGEGRIIDFNYAALRAFGHHRDDMFKLREHELFVDPNQAARFVAQLKQHGALRNFSARLRTQAGEEFDCLIAASQRESEVGGALIRNSVIRAFDASG